MKRVLSHHSAGRVPRRACAGIAVGLAAAQSLSAQQSSSQPTGTQPTLPPVEVTVTRDAARATLELPYALSRVVPDSVRPALRHVSFDEMLLALPGVSVANRNNPTQDPRISIRGFGARSAFGVRGVRVVRDGIPLRSEEHTSELQSQSNLVCRLLL